MKTIENLNILLERSTIPVLWLETGFIWSKSTDIEFWQKLAKLVLENKMVVVDTGQYAEMLERYANDLVTPDQKSLFVLNIYKDIVGKYLAIDHSSFLARQTKIAMSSYTNKETEITYYFSGLFGDLIRSLTQFLDELNKCLPGKWGTARAFKKLSSDIVQDWKNLRKEATDKKQTLTDRRSQELLGMYDVLLKVSQSTDEVKKKNLVYSYLRKWKRISGNNNFDQMLGFFRSDYYKMIPYVNIHSWLISDLIVGSETPRSSDYFDIIMISMILPYADFMVVDGPMRHRIMETLKLIKPKGLYNCKIIKQKDIEEILESIDKSTKP